MLYFGSRPACVKAAGQDALFWPAREYSRNAGWGQPPPPICAETFPLHFFAGPPMISGGPRWRAEPGGPI